MVLRLLGTAVFHQALHHVPVHQRLTTEEVHLQIGAAAGVIHQKVQRLLANLKAHQRAVSMVFSLAGEAVGAVQVAGVRHMQAQRLHHIAGTLLEWTKKAPTAPAPVKPNPSFLKIR